MSQNLLTQLAEYGTYCEERQGSVLADDVIGNVAPRPEPTLARSPGSRRGWLVAAGAAALILILVGGAGWLARSGGAPEPATPTTSTLIPAPPPSAGFWSRVDPATPEGQPPSWVFFDVAETPVGLLATGLDGLWISQDAVEWRPYARDSVEFDDGGFSKIAVSDLGIVVSNPSGDGPVHVWFSPDGEQWTPTDRGRSGIAVSGNGLTASDERILLIDSSNRVMSSTDGMNWQIVEELEASDFHLVEATSFGFFAATRDGGVWISPDGVEWSNLSNQMLGAVPNDIAGSQGGLVAVTLDGRIWHSPAGAQWTNVHSLTPAEDWEHVCTRVGGSEIGFLVVTVHVDDWDDVDSAVPTAWFSEDGRAWSRAATAPLGDTQEHGYVCQNEVIPYEGGFLGVTDNQLANQDAFDMVWLYER